MPSAKDFIDELMHFNDFAHVLPYDPVQRHKQYLKTRQLKGRQPAAIKPLVPNRNTGVVGPKKLTPVVKKAAPKSIPKKAASTAKKLSAQEQVDALKSRLAKLRKVLADLVDQAQIRSGVKPHDTAAQANAKQDAKKAADKKPDKPLTAKQKADARKRAAEAYAKNKTKPISQIQKELRGQIDDVNAKIKAMRASLAKKTVKTATTKKAVPVGAGSKKK